MKNIKFLAYLLLAVFISAGMVACSEDEYKMDHPQSPIEGDYTICDPAYVYWTEIVIEEQEDGTKKEKEVRYVDEIASITVGEVWNFSNGVLTITKPNGQATTGSYSFAGDKCTITFPDGSVSDGFKASYNGITYFNIHKDSEGNVIADYQQEWLGIGEILYITKNNTTYRAIIPARRLLEKVEWNGTFRPEYETAD